MNPIALPIQLLLALAACFLGIWLLVKLLVGLGWLLGQVFRFIQTVLGRIGAFVVGMGSDALRVVGGTVTAAFFVPFIVSNIVLGRWSRANHYGKALEREAVGVGTSLYRLAIGHVGRLLGLTSLTDGIERRIPEAMARAPAPDRPRGRPDAFDGYTVVGSLPSGGSGARLYLAQPLPDKRERLTRNGRSVPGKVVIKSFDLADGSTMPQIVRESRALEAARDMGLVLEHELTASRFHYVMPYVPGDDLTLVTQRLHDQAGPEGLSGRPLEHAMAYTSDLLATMQRFHAAGLWHKDIKPSNIIVSDGRVHLVDLGLTTPLRSAMTLTTHGTEYFRDPELVRLALRGVKVQEVDGVKFDIYGAGAVLYSVIENSFPAHGSLSQIHKRCPEALRWIVRRAMADMSKRYASAAEMLADLRTVMAARDPYAVTPASLPSMSGDPAMARAIADEVDRAHADGFDAAPAIASISPRQRPVAVDKASVAATTRHGGLRWGVTAAVVLLGVFGLGFVALLFRGANLTALPASGGPDVWPAGVSESYPSPIPVGAPTPSGQDWKQVGPAPYVKDRMAKNLAPHRAEPAALLVVDDLAAAADDDLQARVDGLLRSLELANFELLGVAGDDETPDDDMALVSEARLAIGQASAWDGDVADRLDRVMDEAEPRLSGVVRIARGDTPGTLMLHAVAQRQQDALDLASLLDQGARGRVEIQALEPVAVISR